MKGTRAILAAALLTGLPLAAHSQGTRAPADAFLYIIWPPDGTTVKGAFWCRFGLRGMGVTQAGSNAPNAGHHHLLIDADEPLDPNEPIRRTRHIFISEPVRLRRILNCRPASTRCSWCSATPSTFYSTPLSYLRRSPSR